MHPLDDTKAVPQRPGAGAEAGDGAPLVLVAEDEESSREALCEVIRDAGFRCVGVGDGLRLLERAAALRPAAVVLDLAMPFLNGMEAAAALRSGPATRDLPILALTASWLADRGELLASAGFDGALRKPCSPERLLAELRRVLAAHDSHEEAGLSGVGPRSW